jgi:hypothetical protein
MSLKYWLYILLHALIFILGLYLSGFENVIYSSVGASLIAAGITGWVVFIYVFITSRVSERLALIESSGIINVFSFRSVAIRPEYETRLNKARDKIDIIGFGLRALREDFSNDFEQWAQKACVRILLIDPDYPEETNNTLADLRDIEEGNPPSTIRRDVYAFLKTVKPLMESNPQFQVRLYTNLPAINYFRVDNEIFWGPYLLEMQSRSTPTILVRRSGTLFPILEAHFDSIWKNSDFSKPIPLDLI